MAKAEVRARAKKLISLGQLRPLSYARPLLNVPKQEPRKHSEKLFGVGGLRSLKYPRPILTMGDALPLFDRLYPLKEPLRRVLEITGTPGCAIHVCHRGEEWTANFGVLSIVSERPVTSDSIFYLTSLTTGITAAAFATLVHEGKVDWTTPVRSVIPEVNDARLTPLDLLSMRSGYYPADALTWQGENIALLLKADTVKHWNALPQLGEFRNSYKYNSWGYALVGILIERLTGQTLSQVFKDRIFDPLELKNTQMFQWGYNHHNFEATRSLRTSSQL
ncbi:hypothetical protein RRF57_005955 [Xylaria bambusicola]|uniref:Beta-lactamase-related domain-containing protein n=1 Tax=Xylaria bambusicola TaxID=326684 RepID=A0AAN7UDH3_9PEZI